MRSTLRQLVLQIYSTMKHFRHISNDCSFLILHNYKPLIWAFYSALYEYSLIKPAECILLQQFQTAFDSFRASKILPLFLNHTCSSIVCLPSQTYKKLPHSTSLLRVPGITPTFTFEICCYPPALYESDDHGDDEPCLFVSLAVGHAVLISSASFPLRDSLVHETDYWLSRLV